MEHFVPKDQTPAEELLCSWLSITFGAKGNRYLNNLSLNAMAILNLLSQVEPSAPGLTASELTRRTGLLKSQMNKELKNLKDINAVETVENPDDKRSSFIHITKEGSRLYEDEHKKIIVLFQTIEKHMGSEETLRLARDMRKAIAIVDENLEQ